MQFSYFVTPLPEFLNPLLPSPHFKFLAADIHAAAYVPSQFESSAANSYPVPQEHSNDPKVLVHIWLHPPLRVEHSSTSISNNIH